MRPTAPLPPAARPFVLLAASLALLALAAGIAGASAPPSSPIRCEQPRTAGSSGTHGGGGLMLPLTLDQITDEATLVFAGRVAAFQSCSRGSPDSIFTVVTVITEKAFKGTPGKAVRLNVPGGSYGGYRLEVGTSPEFTAGERVVVFAAPIPGGFTTAQGYQGKLAVNDDGSVLEGRLTLETLGAAVRRAAQGQLPPSENFVIGHPPDSHTNYNAFGWRWTTDKIPAPFNFNVTDSRPSQLTAQAVRNAIANALHTWQNENSAYIAFGPLSETTRTSAQNGCDGRNDTTFGINDASHPSGALATTYSCFSGQALLDADVEIDVDHFGSRWRTNGQGNCDSYFDLETVLLHEYGHALGLGHPSFNGGCPNSCPVMDGSYGGIQRTLCSDDIVGVVAVYTVVAGSPPAPPSAVNASRNGAVTITWSNVSNELGYEVWRAPTACATAQPADFKLLDSVPQDTLSYVDNDYGGGLDPGTTYCYKLRAFNTSGNGAFSPAVQSDGSQSPTPSPSPTPTPSPSPTPTPTPTPTPSPTPSASPTLTPTPTPSPTPTPTLTPTPTPTPTPTATPTPTPTRTPTPTPSPAPPTGGFRGDTDCNGVLDAVDALHVLRTVAHLPSEAHCIAAGDTDCDGDMDAIDALLDPAGGRRDRASGTGGVLASCRKRECRGAEPSSSPRAQPRDSGLAMFLKIRLSEHHV